MLLEGMLESIQRTFPFLRDEGFQVIYRSKDSYPYHTIRIGFESKVRNIRLLFLQEAGTGLYIGSLDKPFTNESEWFYFRRLIDFILKRPLRWKSPSNGQPYDQHIMNDLMEIGKEFQQHSEKIYSMFRDENAIKEWDADFREYVNKEIQRKLKRPK